MSTAVVALLLLPLALALVVLLVGLLVAPLLVPALGALERARFQRRLAHAARADSYLAARQRELALRELEAAFCLMVVRSDPRLPDQVVRHHDGLLTRLLSLADDAPQQRVRLFALKKVDRLLERRREMQRAYLQLQARPWRDSRRQKLEHELRRNGAETRAAVRELVADIQVLSSRTTAVQ